MAQLIGGEMTVVRLLTGGDQVVDDAGQFVGSGCNGLWSTEFGSYPSAEVTEGALAVVGRLRSDL